ncbi:caspase-3-like [Mytilus californianus]|uniref:caspase-3-like n=1 Tax=Mytilus californianus TaxID=6549 RepID=UPI0022454DA7|nr:caspase-3-like [Mytilus californianus]
MGKHLSKSSTKQKDEAADSSSQENDDHGFYPQYPNVYHSHVFGTQRYSVNQQTLGRYTSVGNLSTTPTTSDYVSEIGRNPSSRASVCVNTERPPNKQNKDFETDARPSMRRSQSCNQIPDFYSMNEEYYSMNHPRRGDCVIFNIKHVRNDDIRSGTEQDGQKLKKTFSSLGFEVIEKVDVTKKEFKKEIKTFADRNHDSDDCFVCVILSHGREGYVNTTDGELSLTAIMDPIKKCKSLLGKPKLFFIQACRGNKIDFGNLAQDGSQREGVTVQKLSSESDVLIAYSTTSDYVAWRNTEMGSIYIEILCEILRLEGAETKLTELLQKVNNCTSKYFDDHQCCQVPCFTSSLRKSLLFSRRKQVVMIMYNDGTYENVPNPIASINDTIL